MTSISRLKSPFYVSKQHLDFLKQIRMYNHSPEPGVVISAPLSGMPFRINQLIQNHSNIFLQKPINIQLGIGMEDISNIENHLKTIGYRLSADKLCLLVSNTDFWFKEKTSTILTDLVNIQRSTTNLKLIFFSEKNLLCEENANLIKPKSLLGQIYYYPMFDTSESGRYLSYLAELWNISDPKKSILKTIVKQCGNHMWLLTQALREYRLKTVDIENSPLIDVPSIKFRLDLIAKSFSNEEIETISTKTDKYLDAKVHLQNIGILSNNRCTVPMLYEHLLKSKTKYALIIKNNDIFLNGINLRYSFTDQESLVLKTLLKNIGIIITRDQIAEIIWRREASEKYSVWAIEQLIRRLRKKLNDICPGSNIICTKRSGGYYIND